MNQFQETAANSIKMRSTLVRTLLFVTALVEASPKEAQLLLRESGETIEACIKAALEL